MALKMRGVLKRYWNQYEIPHSVRNDKLQSYINRELSFRTRKGEETQKT